MAEKDIAREMFGDTIFSDGDIECRLCGRKIYGEVRKERGACGQLLPCHQTCSGDDRVFAPKGFVV